MIKPFESCEYSRWQDMVFGRSLHPVKAGFDVEIGAGAVIPELKYAPRPGREKDLNTLVEEYQRITRDALDRIVGIGAPAIVMELEHVFQLTDQVEWGREIAHLTKWLLKEYYDRYGLKGALRATIADIRKPENGLWDSPEYKKILNGMKASAEAGADILSIESIGGKEVFNYAVTRQDIRVVVFAVGVLGSLDMAHLWSDIVSIAKVYGVLPGGDTDCAHSNTAMFMAGGLMETQLPHTFAALVRPAGAVRSLVAFEAGATGPDKDCGYEGVILKAITGKPISMEGKTSACAHSDLMGNLSAAVCDLWSNEAVEYGEMFGGTTPQVFAEMLAYDCAQMNASLQMGCADTMRDVLITSDRNRDPQALVLSPDVAMDIAGVIVKEKGYYNRTVRAMQRAAEIIASSDRSGELPLSENEREALESCRKALDELPDDEERFIQECVQIYSQSVPEFRAKNYGIN